MYEYKFMLFICKEKLHTFSTLMVYKGVIDAMDTECHSQVVRTPVSQVQILAQRPPIQTDFFHGFSPSLEASAIN